MDRYEVTVKGQRYIVPMESPNPTRDQIMAELFKRYPEAQGAGLDLGGPGLGPEDTARAQEQLDRPSPPNVIGQGYKDWVAEPLATGVHSFVDPMAQGVVSGARAINAQYPQWFPGMPTTEQVSQATQKFSSGVVPQTLSEAAAMGLTLGVSPFVSSGPWGRGMVARTAAGGVGGALGASLSGENPLKGALHGAGANLFGETAGIAVPAGLKITVGRPLISNTRLRNVQGLVNEAVPEYGQAMTKVMKESTENLPWTSRRASAMATLAQTEEGRDIMGRRLEEGIRRAVATHTQATGQAPLLDGPGLQRVYNAMPAAVRELQVGPTVPIMQTIPAQYGPTGLLVTPAKTVRAGDRFTLTQAQELLAWSGSKAFKEAPLGQGTDDITQMLIWANARKDIATGLHPDAAGEFFNGRNAYGIGEVVQDIIREGGMQAEPNRVLMNHRFWEEYLNRNRDEITRRTGPEFFDSLRQAVMPGAAHGTASRVAPGAGTPGSRMEALGRSSSGGSVTHVPLAALGVVAPNLGTMMAGRQPFRPWGSTGQAVMLDLPAIRATYGITGFGQEPEVSRRRREALERRGPPR